MLVQETINKLKSLTELDIQNHWYFLDEKLLPPPLAIDNNWQKAIANEKKYLVWEKGNKIRWFAQKITIPDHLNNYPLDNLSLRIGLTWWAESAEIYINDKLVCEGDLFDSSSRVLITNNSQPNEEFIISLKLVSPNHDIGGLMSSRCLYESEYNTIDPSFVANELTVLSQYIDNFYPEDKIKLENAIQLINWNNVNNQNSFNQSLIELRNKLLPLSAYIKNRNFYLLGHAHLDMAWLWTMDETYTVAQRTFNSALNLQKDSLSLTFGHTTAYLYQWIENHNKPLFAQIQAKVKNNTWEILGGMWVEAEVNLISGESLIRQVLYGQKYFQEKFAKYNRVAWLPDSFGFPAQLPQILSLGEIDYFVTGKLHWNDTNKFPHGCFWWQSPDGSRIFTAMSPPNVAGVMNTNPVVMSDYSVDWEKQTGLQDIFWLPGVGDHGGGPTRDMLDVVKRYDDSPFFPQVNFAKAENYLDKIKDKSKGNIPIWNEDIYLELHRGCYTTHGDQKYFNRYCEKLLFQAELFSTIINVLNHNYQMCVKQVNEIQFKIDDLWQKVLLNQFHDILPGTSITPVFTEANQLWQEVIEEGELILQDCLKAIAFNIDNTEKELPKGAKRVIIFNSLNWKRSEIVEIDVDGKQYQAKDCQGNILETQISEENKLLVFVNNIYGVGYTQLILTPAQEIDKLKPLKLETEFILQNEFIKAKIDPKTGNLISIYDYNIGKEIINGQGNELQLFQDNGQYWDAWNIDPNYEKYPLNNPKLIEIQWLENGKLRQTIKIVKKYNKSTFTQKYILNCNSPIIYVENSIDWREEYTLLKVNFPLNFTSPKAYYETPCAVMEYPTTPKTALQKAKWEICAHHWVDLSNDKYGVSLLNNCKYGHDFKPNQIRLSLLRSPKWPDPTSDMMIHNFTYAIYPHQDSWQDAKTVHKGYELNVPLQVIVLEENEHNADILPSAQEFLNLGSNNLILTALKQSYDDHNQIIIRCYEAENKPANFLLKNTLNLRVHKKVNILENALNDIDCKSIKPCEIATYVIISESEENV
ncbi:alpha-mannosidase [Cyanobacterium sp. IPPAS B-1200]|uniref:alpha-mannosidase n=1 Tax=Cyanobacterium sp. IPPAS B-1200 TaxID=1562720 RepID=UPI000852515A|nr:alpha-mannosidase [Cyanobacterium sp. IPPAS B-1200]OEJ79394.1 alpha-mannosidase [Cyanobacterium sp. IPPAS B-1200]